MSKGFSTGKGTTLHVSLAGFDLAADAVTDKLTDVLSFNGLEITAEVTKEDDLELGEQVIVASKAICGGFEISMRIEKDDATTYTKFQEAVYNSNECTVKGHLPVGTGINFLANAMLSKVGTPIEAQGALHLNLSFEVSGLPKFI
ncbi:hypothetical protein [Shewanella frigidimarina]|uniref:hypothetical protein n=1 Tax=Shewanella frigidimarina TaxID=56812 RepID=UPI003D7AD9B2